MKKIAISLIALAAISTASFAGDNRNYDLRDSDTYFGKYSTQLKNEAVEAKALVIVKKTSDMTNFDRLSRTAWENDMGRH
jgi:hypothetical protein